MTLPRTTTPEDLLRGVSLLVDELERRGLGSVLGIAYGRGTIDWPGGSAFSNNKNFAHSLGATPTIVLANGTLPDGGFPYEVSVRTTDALNVNLRAHTTDGSAPAAATAADVIWLALL